MHKFPKVIRSQRVGVLLSCRSFLFIPEQNVVVFFFFHYFGRRSSVHSLLKMVYHALPSFWEKSLIHGIAAFSPYWAHRSSHYSVPGVLVCGHSRHCCGHRSEAELFTQVITSCWYEYIISNHKERRPDFVSFFSVQFNFEIHTN